MVESSVSLAAGMIAGGVEGLITYPTEFVKTQLQLQNKASPMFNGPIDCLMKTIRTKGFLALYKGLSPLLIGNSLKGLTV